MKPIATKNKGEVTGFTTAVSDDLFHLVSIAAARPNVRQAVVDNHDNNRWWPTHITDWRIRMIIAGWSARVSYSMIDTYARTVDRANDLGFDTLSTMDDEALLDVVQPIGLHTARIEYLRSMVEFLGTPDGDPTLILAGEAGSAIRRIAANVHFAGYKIAQCAVLYARGYQCGIVPVDSGMISKLAPCLGWALSAGPIAHEQMRALIEAGVAERSDDYLALINKLGYKVTIASETLPTWWVHLVLIYFKRLYANAPADRLCVKRPVCLLVLDCDCAIWDD